VLTDHPYLSIIIPAWNEERRLPSTLEQIMAYLATQAYTYEVIVVDDGSDDNTVAVAQGYGVQVLCCEHKGKGFAVRAGALAAQGDYILLCDADLAVPIEEWPKLESQLDAGYDVAIGSREGQGAMREGEPWYRHLMGRVFNMIIRMIAVGNLQDTQCGFKALKRSVSRDLFRRVRIYGDDSPVVQGGAVTAYDVELLFLAFRYGYRVIEVPVLWRYGEETKVNPLKDTLRNFRDVLKVRVNALRGLYPLGQTQTQTTEQPK
jgi:dolichyl-phosphate beta-glucosyltransferase